MKRGFTLIELMIVVAIIAIIAAISIPSLMRARQAANEGNAAAGCKQMTTHANVFRRTDADGNGIQDYWVADIAAYYAMEDVNGSKLKYIDVAQAKADYAPLAAGSPGYNGTPPLTGGASTEAKAGYFYQVMTTDASGTAYASDTSPDDGVANPYNSLILWGVTAYPAVYGRGGIRIFIINEEGVVYGVDNGKDPANLFAVRVFQWPASDPTAVTAASGKYWGIAQD